MSHLDAPMFPAVPVTADPTAGRTDDHGAVVPAISIRRVDLSDSDTAPDLSHDGPVIELSGAWPPADGGRCAGIGVHLDTDAAGRLAEALSTPLDHDRAVPGRSTNGEGRVHVTRIAGLVRITFAPPACSPRAFLAWPHEARLIAGHLTRLTAA